MITNAHSAHLLLNTKEILAIVLSLCVVVKLCKGSGTLQEWFLMAVAFIAQTIESGSIL
jgi:hypothetical protein